MDKNACLSIFLQSDEYTIQNNTLTTTYSYQTFTDYRKENDSIYLCFPFTENFRRCLKWKFDYSELYFNHSNRNLIYNSSNLTYELGNYDIRRDNSVFLCIPENMVPPSFDLDIFFTILWTLSTIGVLISCYNNISSIGKNRVAQSLQCHFTHILIAYILLIIVQCRNPRTIPEVVKTGFCYFGGYNFLAIYTWLNVMSFDTWRQFSPKRLMIQSSSSLKGFLVRCLYGYGLPLAIIILYTSIDNRNFCKLLIKSKSSTFPYLQIAIGACVIVIINITFFCMLIINIKKAAKEVSQANSNVNSYLLTVYKKLTTLAVISFGSLYVAFILKPTSQLYGIFPCVIISLHGFAIFLLYALNPIINQCRKNYHERKSQQSSP